MVRCPRCNKNVSGVWGNGKYPNESYRCAKCDEKETTDMVGGLLLILVVGLIALVLGLAAG